MKVRMNDHPLYIEDILNANGESPQRVILNVNGNKIVCVAGNNITLVHNLELTTFQFIRMCIFGKVGHIKLKHKFKI